MSSSVKSALKLLMPPIIISNQNPSLNNSPEERRWSSHFQNGKWHLIKLQVQISPSLSSCRADKRRKIMSRIVCSPNEVEYLNAIELKNKRLMRLEQVSKMVPILRCDDRIKKMLLKGVKSIRKSQVKNGETCWRICRYATGYADTQRANGTRINSKNLTR